MTDQRYKLDEYKNVVPCSLREWRDLFCDADKIDEFKVAFDRAGPYDVSTTFTGYDARPHKLHPIHSSDSPLVFETNVMGDGMFNNDVCHASTWMKALETHNSVVAKIKERIAKELM